MQLWWMLIWVGTISKAASLSYLVLGWGDLTRGELEQLGLPGHLCAVSLQTLQHSEFRGAGLHTRWLWAPKVHVPRENPR